jgi:hypothetical protein
LRRLRPAIEDHRSTPHDDTGGVPAASARRLLRAADGAAMGSGWGVCLLLDDVDHAPAADVAGLVELGCEAADQGWAVGLVATGLPSVAALLAPGDRRLVELGPLGPEAVDEAVGDPVGGVGSGIEAEAVAAVGVLSGGHPLLLQAFAGQAWNEADHFPITVLDVEAGRRHAEVELETWFFADALHDLVPSERRYLLAMADLGDDRVPADAVARRMGATMFGSAGARVAAARARLEELGLIHSADGDHLDFSLPLLGGYLRARG